MLPIINLSFFLLLLGLLPAATQAASLLLRVRDLIPTESCSLQGLRLGRQLHRPASPSPSPSSKKHVSPPAPPSTTAILIKGPPTPPSFSARQPPPPAVQNNFLFGKTSHFARSDIADAIAKSFISCCEGTDDFCNNKPFSTMSGDTGLTAIVQIQNPEEECKSPNGGAEGKLEDAEVIGKTAKFFADLFSAFRG
ncbi:hypothetical protein BBK36DRAFT_1162264 [Trichoderma citrinoviride]|uniref:Uncharacterized protein n=1 Tax=Trichoderma citrinoviride TaxID=58853 RepID=A0A2T4B2L2_9HYPO|nr:hypothetical protein BBK36DRAFT_1162264 [Trichoderma citrinoviride]PTB63562.1 hypothetical protein BBK36DRAFT_1162264 [Trichoderma citrinoviride]